MPIVNYASYQFVVIKFDNVIKNTFRGRMPYTHWNEHTLNCTPSKTFTGEIFKFVRFVLSSQNKLRFNRPGPRNTSGTYFYGHFIFYRTKQSYSLGSLNSSPFVEYAIFKKNFTVKTFSKRLTRRTNFGFGKLTRVLLTTKRNAVQETKARESFWLRTRR